MRILFLNAVNKNDFAYTTPLSIAYLGGYLKKKARMGNLFAKSISSPDTDKIKKVLVEYDPHLVGITATSVTFGAAVAVSGLIKEIKSNVPIVVGGQHISLVPESLCEAMDFGVIGEGEQTFLELVEAIHSKKKDFYKIKGLCFREGGKFVRTDPRDFIENLDEVSYPERRLLDPANNILLSSRGCPYDCIFCSSSVMWKRKIRFHSAEYVFKEIYELYERGYSIQWFADDLFVCNKNRTRRLVKLIKENGLYRKILFFAEGRSNLMDDELAHLIKELNVFRISFGFESADDDVLKYAKGRAASVDIHTNASNICRKHGISVDGYFMVGFPPDSPETLQRTYEFAAKYCDFLGEPNLVMVFPGTRLRELLLKETGVDYAAVHLNKFRQNSCLPVEEETICCGNLTKDEILSFVEKFKGLRIKKKMKFYLKYLLKVTCSKSAYTNLRYILMKLSLRLTNPKREFVSETIKLA